MFGKKNTSGESESVGRSAPGKGPAGHNIITASTEVKGSIKAKGDFRIDGVFIGDLSCDAKVIVGEGGKIEGEVNCENAVVEGKFQGNLTVSDVLYVKETAVIHGEVVTGKLVVQSGSIFEVNCKMTDSVAHEIDLASAGKNIKAKG